MNLRNDISETNSNSTDSNDSVFISEIKSDNENEILNNTSHQHQAQPQQLCLLSKDGEHENNQIVKKEMGKSKKKNEDIGNILFLLFMYTLQGIPFGLSFSVPLILSSRKVSYADQGTFSFASWPFSMKLLWAPLVDSVYIKRIGRRRTWAVSTLFLTGIIMVSFASYTDKILDTERVKQSKDIYVLTLIFGTIVALVTTQDVVIDGWSLDLLLKENVQWQAVCNSFGMGLGSYVGNAAFLTFESANFCNQYIRPLFNLPAQKRGIITVEQFFCIIGIIEILTAILILIFKKETNPKKQREDQKCLLKTKYDENQSKKTVLKSIGSTYKLIWKILWLVPMRKLILLLLTLRIGFATESVVRLKMVEAGVAREKISLLSMFTGPFLVILPLLLTKYTNGPRPLDFLRKGLMFKLIMILIFSLFVQFTPSFQSATKSYPLYYYIIYLSLNLIGSIFNFITYVSMGSFYAQISDKSIGGTYMTFLSLWSSLGSNWTRTAALYLINFTTFKYCAFDDMLISSFKLLNNTTSAFPSFLSSSITNSTTTSFGFANSATSTSTNSANSSSIDYLNRNNLTSLLLKVNSNKCSSDAVSKNCVKLGAKCLTKFDSFYTVTILFVLFGLIWLIFTKKITNYLQEIPKTEWLVIKSDGTESAKPKEQRQHNQLLQQNLKTNDNNVISSKEIV